MQFTQSLLVDNDDVHIDNFAINRDSISSVSSRHGRLSVKATPKINYSEYNWFPQINRREWHDHTSKMLFIEWMPLTYFMAAGVITSMNIDRRECSAYANNAMENIMIYVFGPILFMRILGFVFMDKPKLIIYQIMLIYSYLAFSLGIWEYKTMMGMIELPRECFSPLSVSMLNLMTMTSFYIFFLTPYLTILMLIPYYLYLVYKNISRKRQ